MGLEAWPALLCLLLLLFSLAPLDLLWSFEVCRLWIRVAAAAAAAVAVADCSCEKCRR